MITQWFGLRSAAWVERRPARTRHPRVLDTTLALALFAIQVAGSLLVGGPASRFATHPVALALTLAGDVALVVCRRFPASVATVVALLVVVETATGWPPLSAPALLVAAARLAAARGRRGALVAAIATAGVLLIGPAISATWSTSGLLTRLALALAAVTSGLYLAAVRGWRAEAQERRVRQEQERLLRAEAAVAQERVRIARELHDVVAHYLSLVVLQAGAARATLPEDAAAIPAVEAVERASRHALEEMRRMVGVLRLHDTGVAADRAPQPSLRDLPLLVAHARAAGHVVTLSTAGDLEGLPNGIDLSAYRVVQEALTNMIRHAGATHAEVAIRRDPDLLTLTVIDDGVGQPPSKSDNGRGHGLIGMRERVTLLGGRLSAGPRPVGGWAVRAEIPLPAGQA